jgi:hypothetical protein
MNLLRAESARPGAEFRPFVELAARALRLRREEEQEMEKGNKGSDRGKPAGFDPRSGEVSGSGAGAGGNPDAAEDYDSDLNDEAARRDSRSKPPSAP